MFHITGGDDARIRNWMNDLKTTGKYEVPEITKNKIKDVFWGGFCDDNETFEEIRNVNNEYGYVMDTHTAVAKNVYEKYIRETGDTTKTVIVSTASPFKFSDSVLSAILGSSVSSEKDPFALLDELAERTGLMIPASLGELKNKAVIFTTKCEKEEMYDVVSHMLNLA